MTNKPNVPGEIFLGNKDYSIRMDWKVSGWLFLATLISCFSDIMFPRVVQQWPIGWRVTVATVPFLLILLWIRNLAQWIRGMDELHRRITVVAILFAVSSTFFFVMLWHRLDVAGFFSAVFPRRSSWDIATVGHAFLLLTFFYFLGHTIFNRRYK